jgi:GntR family transcriptional regulator
MRRMAAASPTFSPLYRQTKALLVQSLDGGEWKPGEAIPSELELASRFGVSQGTVRKAIDELAGEHILVRRQGKGTFVATHSEQRQLFRFLRLVPFEGEQEYPGTRLLECRRTRAPAEIAKLLDLRTGDGIVSLRRVLLFQGEPTVLDEISLPAAQFKGLTAATYEEHKGSLYRLFESEFGTRMIRAEEKLRAIAADGPAAEVLEVAVGTPLLCVDRVAFTYGDRPVEFRRGLYRTDRHYYKNDLG